MRLAKARGKLLAVLAQFGEHVQRLNILGVIVQHALRASDAADGLQRGSADLANAFRNRVRHRIKLIRLFIQQQVIIAEVGTAHVPMEVLGLDVKREHIRQDAVHCRSDVPGRHSFEVGTGSKRRLPANLAFAGVSLCAFVHFRLLSAQFTAQPAEVFDNCYHAGQMAYIRKALGYPASPM
jgi:hypothetical protein